MSTLEEIQKRVDDLQREWASDDASQTAALRAPYGSTVLPEMDLSEKPMVLPEMDLSAPPESDPGPKDVGPGASSLPALAAAPPPPRMPQAPSAGPERSPIPADRLRQASAPDWEKLQRELQAAEGRAGTQRTIQQAFATVSPNHAFHADPNAGSEDIAAAKAPLEMAQARQGVERGQAALGAEKRKEDLQAAEMDPNSPQSQRARGALKGFFGDTKLLPPDFDNYSAADVSKFSTTLVPLAKDQSTERTAALKERAVEGKATKDLADRKTVMTSNIDNDPTLSPEEKATFKKQVDGINSLGSATAQENFLNARMGARGQQTHADESAARAQAHSDQAAALTRAHEDAMQSRREAFEKAMKEDARTNAPLTTEQKQALEGFAAVPGVLKILDSSTADTNSFVGKMGAAFPTIAGALGAPGATFHSSTEAAASVLARIVDGGTARPGTIEILQQILPKASDSPEVKALRRQQLQDYIEAKHAGVLEGIRQSGAKLPVPAAPIAGPAGSGGVTLVAKDGRKKSVSRAAAEQFMKDHPGEATIQP